MNSSIPTLSIIVPVYNSENHLDTCLQSIINQTYTDFEVILVNDGSTDQSGKICDNYALYDPRIIVIHQANAGPGSARNAGIDRAKGRYLGFVDSDDFVDEIMFEAMINHAIEQQADIVQCGYRMFTPQGELTFQSKNTNHIISGVYDCVLEYGKQNEINNFITTKIFSSTIVEIDRFPILYASEDAVFILQMCLKCQRMVIMNEAYYNYIQEPKSLTRNGISIRNFDKIHAGKMMHKIVEEQFPELSSYWALYIVLYCVKLFARLKKYPELKQHRVGLIHDFKRYYPMLKNNPAMKQISKKSSLGLKLFSCFPEIYALLYRSSH